MGTIFRYAQMRRVSCLDDKWLTGDHREELASYTRPVEVSEKKMYRCVFVLHVSWHTRRTPTCIPAPYPNHAT